MLDPYVGEEVSGPSGGAGVRCAQEHGGCHTETRRNPPDEDGERRRAMEWLGRRGGGPIEGLDERAAAEDPGVGGDSLSGSPAYPDRGPPAETPNEAPTLELRAAALGKALRHEGPVSLAGAARLEVKLGEDGSRGLPWPGDCPQKGALARPGVAVEGAEIGDHPRPERIQVDVPHKFEQIRFLLHHDRLIAILEEMANTLMAPVEGARVAREERSHHAGQGPRPSPDEEVGVVREECPGVDREAALRHRLGKPIEEVGPVGIPPKDGRLLNPPHHHMVEGIRGIESRTAWHVGIITLLYI
jgi:hypothetical protein